MSNPNDGTPFPKGRIDIISDVVCPWCYIGKRRLEGALPLLAAEGLEFDVQWHAYQLNPDMPEAGRDRLEYRIARFGSLEAAQEKDAAITETARAAGLDFNLDRLTRAANTVAAHRTVWLAQQHGVQDAVVEALFRAYFTEGQDIGSHKVLIDVADKAGLAGDRVAAMLTGDEGRREVLAEDSMARRSGLSGVPTFTMAGHVLFSGAVPSDAMAEAFGKAWRILSAQAA